MHTERKKELSKKISELSAELQSIQREERDAEHQKLIGKCFRCRNSYSSPSAGWWLYSKVIGVDEGGLRILQFEICEHGSHQLRREWRTQISDSYEEISRAKYKHEWAVFLKSVEDTGNA